MLNVLLGCFDLQNIYSYFNNKFSCVLLLLLLLLLFVQPFSQDTTYIHHGAGQSESVGLCWGLVGLNTIESFTVELPCIGCYYQTVLASIPFILFDCISSVRSANFALL